MKIEIETKFEEGIEVHFMKNNKPTTDIIDEVVLYVKKDDSVKINYRMKSDYFIKEESEVFGDKEILKKALFS